jgi:phospholipid/cholesterol/gamma-HCH transport system permease protein
LIQKLTPLPGADIARWLSPLGQAWAFVFGAFSIESIMNLSWPEYRKACIWMGLRSFHMVTLSAVFVAATLTIQLIVELKKYQAQDVTAALIAVGLLREIGPLTIGLAWCARIAACISDEAQAYKISNSGANFAQTFILPRYLAAVTMALPLATYGLIIGFTTGAIVSPLLGGCSFWDFLHSGMQAVHDKDLLTYFLKLVFVNPTIAVFAACICGTQINKVFPPASSAVTATFLCAFIANLAITIAIFLP